jgi:hypothetical protein
VLIICFAASLRYSITSTVFVFLAKKSSNTKITPAGGFALSEHQETKKGHKEKLK